MQIHACLPIVMQVIIVRKTILVVWLVFTAHINRNKVRRHASTPLLDIMSQEPRKPHKQHVRPVPHNHNKARRHVTTVPPVNTSHNKARRHASTPLLGIMSQEPRKPRKQHVRQVPHNHNKARRHVKTVPPVDTSHNKAKSCATTVPKDIVHKARPNPCHVPLVIILLRAV